jgi:hypothetical protein
VVVFLGGKATWAAPMRVPSMAVANPCREPMPMGTHGNPWPEKVVRDTTATYSIHGGRIASWICLDGEYQWTRVKPGTG